jgi:plasmid stabilization system protein ParE
MRITYALCVSEAAELDIKDAFLWYEEQGDDLGLAFEKQITKTIQTIQKSPLNIQIRYKQTRFAFLKKFPYGVHFIIIENQIIIIAVFHTSRNPKSWEER